MESRLCARGVCGWLILILLIFSLVSNSSLVLSQEPVVQITDVAWSPDGQFIASIDTRGFIRVINTEGVVILNLKNPSGRAKAIAWSPDSTKIVTGDVSGAVKVWNVSDPNYNPSENIAVFLGHEETVLSVAWSPIENYIASVSNRGSKTVFVWDALHFSEVPLANRGISNPFKAAWNTDGSKFALATEVGVFVFDNAINLPPVEDLAKYLYGEFVITPAFAWHPDGEQLVAGNINGEIYLINLQDGLIWYPPVVHDSVILALAWHPTENIIASASDDGELKIWNIDSGTILEQVSIVGDLPISLMSWSPSGTELAYGNGPAVEFIEVTLKGDTFPTASTDSEGSIVSYDWQLDDATIATGPSPRIELPIGEHRITLLVTDNDGLVDTDEVMITIRPRSS